MTVLVLILMIAFLYVLIGFKSLSIFTRHYVKVERARYPQQSDLDDSDRKNVLFNTNTSAIFWPVMLSALALINFYRGSIQSNLPSAEYRKSIIEKRLNNSKEQKAIARIIKQNREMATKLGLPTDEYEEA